MKSAALSFLRSFAPIFRPPFQGLWLVALLYYAWCFLVYPHSQVLRGNFPDPDDYMYLVQVMDWMKGQSWYDNIQHRLNPPEGVMIHFSRLAMLPMVAIVWLMERITGLGLRGSSILMAMVYPLILLGAFLVVMKKVAESFMPKDWAGVTSYVALFSTALMYMFQPGHVDHHGLMILVVAAVMGCAFRMMEQPSQFRWGLLGGITLAIGITLALEILPWVLIIAAWLGFWAVLKGREAAKHGLVFALSLHIASILCLLITRRPADFFTIDVLTYSVVYVLFTGGIAVAFAAVAVVADFKLPVRILIGTLASLICGALFLHAFPELIAGPYGAMDEELQDLILGEVNEAQPLYERFRNPFLLFAHLSATLLALGVSGWIFWIETGVKRWLWGLLLALLTAAFLLTTFYQCRYGGTMGMLDVIPLAVLLQRGYAAAAPRLQGRAKVFAEIGLLLLVGPLPSVLLPAMMDNRSFNTGVILFPVTSSIDDYCDTYMLEQVLRNSIGLGNRPRLIMNDMGLGPELLFRTSHKVLAAPFLDLTGNMDAYRFFSTPYPDEAENIALRRHIDLVVSCKMIPASYMKTNITQPNGQLAKDFAPHFIEMIITGKVPSWLKPVRIPILKNFVIYEVVHPEDNSGVPLPPPPKSSVLAP